MGWHKDKRGLLAPTLNANYETQYLQGSASSAGKTIGPRGTFALYSTSTVASTPTVCYLGTPKTGDYLEAFCLLASSSAGFVLRTSTSGTLIGSTSGPDSVFFTYAGQNAQFRALSTALWMYYGSTAYLATSTS